MPSPSSSKSRSLVFFIFTIRISSLIFLFFFSIFIIYLSMMNLMNFVLLKQNLFIICHECITLFWGLMCSSKQNRKRCLCNVDQCMEKVYIQETYITADMTIDSIWFVTTHCDNMFVRMELNKKALKYYFPLNLISTKLQQFRQI